MTVLRNNAITMKLVLCLSAVIIDVMHTIKIPLLVGSLLTKVGICDVLCTICRAQYDESAAGISRSIMSDGSRHHDKSEPSTRL